MKSTPILLGLALSLCAAPAHGQNVPTVKPGEHTSWYRIVYVATDLRAFFQSCEG